MLNQELNGREMYVTFVGLTETNLEQSLARGRRVLLCSPAYIAFSIAIPHFPVSPYTLQSADDQYCLSLSTFAGDITHAQIERLRAYFLDHVIATDRVLISLTPAQLVGRYGFLKLREPSPATLLIMKNVDVELVSFRSPSITDAQDDAQVTVGERQNRDHHVELSITAMSVDEVQRGLDARLSRRAYERNHMTAKGYWYVAA